MEGLVLRGVALALLQHRRVVCPQLIVVLQQLPRLNGLLDLLRRGVDVDELGVQRFEPGVLLLHLGHLQPQDRTDRSTVSNCANNDLDLLCADNFAKASHPREGLYRYERDRRPKTAEIVRQNRIGGPERVIDEVEKLAPEGFDDVNDVLSHDERQAIVRGYAKLAGFAARK